MEFDAANLHRPTLCACRTLVRESAHASTPPLSRACQIFLTPLTPP